MADGLTIKRKLSWLPFFFSYLLASYTDCTAVFVQRPGWCCYFEFIRIYPFVRFESYKHTFSPTHRYSSIDSCYIQRLSGYRLAVRATVHSFIY